MMAMKQLKYQSANKSETQRLRFMLPLALPIPCKKSVTYGYVSYWCDLPKDLLEVIFDHRKRSAGDLIRVSAVCKSWQLVADSVRQQQDETGPFFLLLAPTKNIAHDDQQRQLIIYHLFDFFKNKEVDHKLPDTTTHGDYSFISWNEWLVTLNCGPCKSQIRFINLLSRVQVGLPCPSSIDIDMVKLGVRKVIFSTTPSDPNCVFMAICLIFKKLAFCKQGDKGWKFILRDEWYRHYFHNSYRDVIYFKGKFYAVAVGGYLDVCYDIDSLEPKVHKVAPPIANPTSDTDTLYLVESSGDLLLVIRTSEYNGNSVNGNGVSETFKLYKLNLNKRKWRRIKSLRDDSAIFAGHVSMSVSAKDFPVKRDCIYFTNPYQITYFGKDTNRCHVHDIGVFNLKTNLCEPTFLFSRKWPCSIFWVSP